MEHVCYMICLDTSEPSLVKEEYTKWMTALEETQKRLLGRLDAQTQGKLMDKRYVYIQYIYICIYVYICIYILI